ncbi:hypothetical protein [Allosediminivita pacifica]|uniref:Uncharacterized protein n=1 Tax=Allosediminivita pacifica TaxID=1267769 RepID=A0A2T6ABH6_9RHOB|nr:hypothetical protein [Allosediminivita pacifica]PTX41161.1 hypothetical protein C8N44_1312 [Allosediminivita pacifica]GGB24800.1 hypothetical protein GCM10011324_38460 [Allosediminivita pacifica]
MLTGTTMSSSPLWTGQPFGPQAAQEQPNPDQWVPPITQARDPDAQLNHGQPPTRFWRLVGGGPDPATHIAPPSIVQIRITQLLNDQVPANENARTEEAEARAEAAEARAEAAESEAEVARGETTRPATEDTPRGEAATRTDAASAAVAALEDRAAIAAVVPALPETRVQL